MSLLTSNDMIMVGADLTFRTRYSSIGAANTALKAYAKGIESRDEWVYEENTMPIFLDTCVLLNLYDISETERIEFIKFIQKLLYIPKDQKSITQSFQKHFV